MRQRNIISLAVLVLTLALSGGCQRMPEPDAGSGTISFSTRSLQLTTGVTKGGTTKEGTNFADDGTDSLAVFGWHSEGEGDKWIFVNQEVTCGTVTDSRNETSYDPAQPWEWANNTTDYYDFIAFYKWKSGSYTKSASPTTVSVPYDATVEQYDLMAAGMRRLGSAADPIEIVPLTFRHLLCAVKVIVYNDSDAKNFTLTDLHFKGLVVSDEAVLSLTPPSTVSVNWIDPALNTNSELFGFDCGEDPGITVHYGNSGNSYSWPDGEEGNGNYNLLVPQTLTASAKLEMDYWYSNGGIKERTLSLGLSTVPNETDGRLLTTWAAGRKYEYQIHIRVDGGVVVTVITTEWDPVEAQTHGIML